MAKKRVTLDDPAYEEEIPAPQTQEELQVQEEPQPVAEPETPEEKPEPAAPEEKPEPAAPAEPAPQVVVPVSVTTEVRDPGTELKARLTALLKVPMRVNSLPTLSVFATDQGYSRYFLMDVDADAFAKAWDAYYEYKGAYDPEGFMLIVNDVLGGIPRMHRAVDWVPLKKRE